MAKAGLGLALALLVGLASGAPGTVLAQASQTGDLQWAQTILKDKGFNIGGRANGQMTPQTHNALSAYQKSVGLPATGNLDQATVSHMMADRAAKAPATVGNLAQQKPGHGFAQEPRHEVAPRAAQRGGPVAGAGGGEAMLGAVVRDLPPGVALPPAGGSPATPGPVSAGGEGASPRAAPHAAVTASTADGQIVPTDALSKDHGGRGGAPGWARYVVMAVLGVTLGLIGFGWWRSGQAPSLMDGPSTGGARREPRFTLAGDERPRGPAARGPRLGEDVRARL